MEIKKQWWPLASYWSDDMPKGTLMLVDKIVRNEAHSGGFAVRVLGTKKRRYARAVLFNWMVCALKSPKNTRPLVRKGAQA